MTALFILKLVSFLSAFLLFQIELIIAKILLPQYGGSYLVWGACMVFFQAALLVGYLYSHLAVGFLGMPRYRYGHLLLLLLPLWGMFQPGWPANSTPRCWLVALEIFGQLGRSIGPVFFALATVSMVMQAWLSASRLTQRSNPYVLYSISNLGSFVALLSYPFFIEPFFDLPAQILIWRIAYLIVLILNMVLFWQLDCAPQEPVVELKATGLAQRDVLSWILLGMIPTVMFMSVTNLITIDVTPAPLLWILPLCIYLLSFVLVFRPRSFCPRWIKSGIHQTMGFGILLYFFVQGRFFPFILELILLHVILWLVCLYCQDELYRQKPADSKHLINFYFLISLGSFLGGVLVSWIIPRLSNFLLEYFMGFFGLAIYLIANNPEPKLRSADVRYLFYWLVFLGAWPFLFSCYNLVGMMFLIAFFTLIFQQWRNRPHALLLAVIGVLVVLGLLESSWSQNHYSFRQRNYYGILKVYEKGHIRFLMHGTTIHGAQSLEPSKQKIPTAYFSHHTPIGQILDHKAFSFRRIAVIGLGTGTLATYLNKNQSLDFYELDPDVYTVAQEYFSYLKNSAGKIHVILGDARVSLKNSSQHYDLIVIDAFSGDSIPLHLLTVEAIDLYRRHLNPNGLILFHISNRYLRLAPILLRNSKEVQAYIAGKRNTNAEYTYVSSWVAMTWSKRMFEGLALDLKWYADTASARVSHLRPWTDQYTSIVPLIDYQDLWIQLKYFNFLNW